MGELFDTATQPLYAVMAFTDALLVAVMAYSSMKNLRVTGKHHIRIFLWVMLFCIQDGIWGLFASHTIRSDLGLYIVSYGFHFFAISSSVVWSIYFVARLDNQIKKVKLCLALPVILALVQFGMLAANIPTKFMFYVDERGEYTTTDYRAIMFYMQFAVYILIGLITMVSALRSEKEKKEKLIAVFAVNMAPIISSIFQMFYPDAPYDSLGFTFGCLIIHSFLTREYEKQVFDLKVLREDLKQALKNAESANRAKSTFLFNMSHDIRTPMNAILGYTNMAKKCQVDEKVAGYLNKIDISGNQLLSLINQVLDMSRIESGRIVLQEQKINLMEAAEVVRTVYAEQARGKKIDFTVDVVDVKHVNVIGDFDRITQVCNNLNGNAIKYTPEGGTIKNTVREVPSDDPSFARFEFIVQDNGIGMSKDYIPHLFEEFSREENSTVRKIQGTGLGMSIVKKLVDLMGGSIDVTSEPGKGTCFVITLSLKIDDGSTGAAEKNETVSDVSLKGMKVLLVEDIEMNREIAQDILNDYEIRVDMAENGAEAVEKVKNSQPGQYDLVLMDVQMPVMNGYEATHAIRALENRELAAIPVVAMTANAFEEDKQDALAAGMNAHISKPISIPKLVAALGSFKK